MMRCLYVNKTINLIKELILSKKIYIYLIITFFLGVLLMISGKRTEVRIKQASTPVLSENYSTEAYSSSEKDIEKELINILKKVEGVGDVDIIINYGSTPEKVPLVESSAQSAGKIISVTDGSKSEPYILTEISPKIKGVVIVAQGGNDINVSTILKNAVSGYLDIPVHKISVLKMK